MKKKKNRIDHHRTRIIGTITTVHFLLSVVLFFLWGASTLSRFDGGGPSEFTAVLLNCAFEFWRSGTVVR